MKMSGKRNTNVLSYYSGISSDDDDNDGEKYSIADCDLSSSKANSSSLDSFNSSDNKKIIRRRGRGPSKRPCLNHNAIMARQNRQKKKEYVENIENKLTYYRNENIKLVNTLKQQNINLKRLNAEVSYLKNILKNNTSITALLNSMNSAINNNNNSNKKINKNNQQLNYINKQTKLTDTSENNTMVQDWMNHVDTSFNKINDNKGVDYGINLLENNITPPNSTSNYNSIIEPSASSSSSLSSSSSSSLVSSSNKINEDIIFKDNINSNDDYFQCDTNDLLQSDNLFENLDSSGICLHINSEKISLEFCSICHLNSINSEDP